ncbi:MAG: hypothetical protein IJ223_00515 [Clostridia bacterium]|nr:hypothetical protein [Clostridia bacterium]
MGSYYIPRDLGGETRIFLIFSVKSLISTAIGAFVGLIFYMIFAMMGIGTAGVITMAVFAVLGFAAGTFKIPTIAGLPFTKKVGGEPISEIVIRYVKFRANRKIYAYTKEEQK